MSFEQVGGKWVIEKVPEARLDYTFHFGRWLVDDAIVSAVITIAGSLTMIEFAKSIVDDDGLPDDPLSPAVVDGAVQVWLDNGAAGDKAEVTCKITTAGGRIDSRSVIVKVVAKKWL